MSTIIIISDPPPPPPPPPPGRKSEAVREADRLERGQSATDFNEALRAINDAFSAGATIRVIEA